MNHELTTGKIEKSLIAFSIPMILGNLLQQLYNVADTLIVGKTMGAAALAAVGSSSALMILLTSIVLGLCMGSGVVFAQLYGAKQQDDMKTSIANSFVFVMLITCVIMAVSYLLLDSCILWLRIPSESAVYTKEYLVIIFSGMLFVSLYNFVAAVLRSIGNTVIPLLFLAVSALTNIVLDIVLIVAFRMGIAGAAVATVIAQGLSALCITVYLLVKAKHLCPRRSHMRYSRRLLRLVISNSLLTAIQQSIMNFGILMIQGLVNSFGFAASAAFAVVVKIDAFAYMPAQDFGNAFSTYVAQNYGANKPERIRRGALAAGKLSVLFCAAASLLVYLFAEPLMRLFVEAQEAETIAIGIQYLHTAGACYVGIGILFLLYGFYRGLGQSWVSIVLTVLSLGTRVLLANFLVAFTPIGMIGIWWAIPIGWILADIYGIWYYFVKKRVLLNRDD